MFRLISILVLCINIAKIVEANTLTNSNSWLSCCSTSDSLEQPNDRYGACYKIINTVLHKYTRPFTMLDIVGSGHGCYTFNAAFAHPQSVFVMIDSSDKLLDSCVANDSLDNVILLNTDITPQRLKRLSECEHFDVVVALDIIQKFGQLWREVIDIVLAMGSNIIVELQCADSDTNNQEIKQYLLDKHAEILGKFSDDDFQSQIYLIPTNKEFLERKTWLLPLLKEKNYHIKSDFDQKKLHKKVDYPPDTYQTVNWIPGINLITFKMCGGIFPIPKMIKKLFQSIRDESHNDWMINNMVIQGNKLQLIDYNDPTHNPGGPGGGNNASLNELYDNHCTMMDINDPIKIEHYFWNYLIQFPIRNCSRNRFMKSLIKKDDIVFDIGAGDGSNAQLYVSHHTKVISIESNIKKIDNLYRSLGNNDQIIIVGKQLTANIQETDREITIEELIRVYGFPQYCAFNIKNSEALILQLSRPFNSISFPFSMGNIESLMNCIQYLSVLGYQYFNFSSRTIPQFMISEWKSSKVLLEKIKEFAQKDHESNIFQGFVFARMEN